MASPRNEDVREGGMLALCPWYTLVGRWTLAGSQLQRTISDFLLFLASQSQFLIVFSSQGAEVRPEWAPNPLTSQWVTALAFSSASACFCAVVSAFT